MPLFRAVGEPGGGAAAAARPRQQEMRRKRKLKRDEDGSVLSLRRLCLLSLADNMKELWVKDYADKYLDQYSFRHIMGPFNLLPAELVEELTRLLCNRKQLSRAALHLLLVPQLRFLSLEASPGLVNSALCPHIAARCQGLWSLDLSGAQQLPSKGLSETLRSLTHLRSLSLAGTCCDRSVIRTIVQRCPLLRHLDVSRCHSLPPAALLLLGRGASSSSSGCQTSCTAPQALPPLLSLLAVDLEFGDEEGGGAAAAAYLLLALPRLHKVALDGLTQALRLIQHRRFNQTHEFTDREGVPRLGEVWGECRRRQGAAEEEEMFWEESESDEDAGEDERRASRRVLSPSDEERVTLRLQEVEGLSCDALDSLGHLCPNISSVSVNVDDPENVRGRNPGAELAAGLQTWAEQLRSVSLHYSGLLVELLPALRVAGSSLLSLTLEGVKTSPHTPLLEVIRACPRLRELLISAEPPTAAGRGEEEEEDEEEEEEDGDLPRLQNLSSLTLKFSFEHSQMKPLMSWTSLRTVLRCLLSGSPLLEKLSLVSLPCRLDRVLQNRLLAVDQSSTQRRLVPLGRVRHVELQRTDVTAAAVRSLMTQSARLRCVDVSHCWQISQRQWVNLKKNGRVTVVWT